MNDHLSYPVYISIPIQWGDMDAFGHVNNVMYFKFFESARIAYFEKMGIVGKNATEIGPILASTDCKFIYPLRYPDTIWSTTRIIDIQEDRFTMEYAVFSQQNKRIAAKGKGVIVSFDYQQNHKVHLPVHWIQSIEKIQL